MFSRLFWRDTVERAVSTAAQAALAVLGADAIDVLQTNALGVITAAAGGALLSFLKALAAGKIGDKESASADPKVGIRLRGRHRA